MKEDYKQRENQERKKELIALADFKFCHGKKVYEIKKGEAVEVPEMFLANLKTEKIIK